MATNYRFGYNGNPVDFDDYFVRLDLFATGNLWGWGRNDNGQLGENSTDHKSSGVQTVAGGNDWKKASGSSNFSLGIKSDGTLWGWGNNLFGQLGDNSNTDNTSPVLCHSNDPAWKTVSCGFRASCGIKSDGSLWTWGGGNNTGVLGLNNPSPSAISSPIQTVAYGYDWKSVEMGFGFVLAIKTNGSLWAWGDNTYGQLGDNTDVNKSSPVQIGSNLTWSQISCGEYYASAIKTDGTLWAWGNNSYGQLGDDSIVSKSSPVQTKAAGTNWKQVYCGYQHTSAIKTDGTLWLWGRNSYGALGINSAAHRSSPVQTILAGTNWRQVSAGYNFTVAIKTDGTLWGWGENSYGAVGDNSTTDRLSPVANTMASSYFKETVAGRDHAIALRYLDTP
jgi:alpha-tubulin suppressor-like RCC1 family protein